VTDIVTKLRDAIALEGISIVELRSLLADAANAIEHQAAALAVWKNSELIERAVARGSMERSPTPDEPMTVTEAPTSTPR
jgi:hypothetical protein